jgi:hypothetical protein
MHECINMNSILEMEEWLNKYKIELIYDKIYINHDYNMRDSVRVVIIDHCVDTETHVYAV